MNDMITIILSFQSPLCLRGGLFFSSPFVKIKQLLCYMLYWDD